MFARIALLLLSASFTLNGATKILAIFPVPSISHQVVFRPLTQALAKRGHEVTVITPDPAFPKGETPANLIEIDVHDLSYNKWKKVYEVTSTGDIDLVTQMDTAFNTLTEVVEMQFKLDEVQKIIKEEKFDLLLIEACARPALLVAHAIKAPIILVSSFGFMTFNVETIGAAWHPLLYPDVFGQRLYNLKNSEKITELYNFYRMSRVMQENEESSNEMGKRIFGPDVATISELNSRVDMLFLNMHPIWDDNRPVPPSVIYMGGLHQKPEKELPEDLKTYLDSSKYGVIYVSFGTNVKPSLLPPERVKLMAKVFSELRYDVLWKWDSDDPPGRSMNIRLSKWLPQSDLLKHPKIKLFVTQGGLQSTDEAITARVPLIGIPMLGDQWYNTEKYVHHGIGVKLDLLTMTEEEFRNSITTVIDNQSYRKNITRLRSVMRDQTIPPLDRAVWWTEHVLRHGGARHLRAPAANMSWAQYLELKLVLTLLAFVLGFTLLFSFLVYNFWKLLSNNRVEIRVKDHSS